MLSAVQKKYFNEVFYFFSAESKKTETKVVEKENTAKKPETKASEKEIETVKKPEEDNPSIDTPISPGKPKANSMY